MSESGGERATIGGGCFWCVEAAFKAVRGVTSVTSGYAGGTVADPSYEAVCSGDTGHAEVVQISYDPEEITYRELLEIFFTIHDPTTLNREGPDVGSQYRSVIFYHDDEQRADAEAYIDELETEGVVDDPIVTEVEPLEEFYEAEPYHQDYYEKNPDAPYCMVNIAPKLEKLESAAKDKLTH